MDYEELRKILAGANQMAQKPQNMSVGEPAQVPQAEPQEIVEAAKDASLEQLNTEAKSPNLMTKPELTDKVQDQQADRTVAGQLSENAPDKDMLQRMRENISRYEQKVDAPQEDKGWNGAKLQDAFSGLHNILNYGSGSLQKNLATDARAKENKMDTSKRKEDFGRLQELQKLYSDYQTKTKKKEETPMTAYQKAQLEGQQADRELKERLAMLKKEGKAAPVTEFQKALEKKQAADFAASQDGLQKTSTALSKVEDALDSQLAYTKDSMTGTGPIATLGGLTKMFSGDTEQLEAKFKEIDLKNMVSTFSGMSKAVDSDAERKAWKATQASVANDDETNVQILLGSKSSLMKDRAIAEAKADWVKQNGNLDGFTHPILKGEVSTLVNPNGEMVLVPKKQFPNLKKAGFKTLDEHSKQLLSGQEAPKYVTMVAPDGSEATVKQDMIQKYLDKGAVIKE